MSGELTPGTMLSENELATSLSMSRTPVRAALARLEDEGLIAVYAKRGALVRELSPREISEAAEVRLALESAGVHSAGRRSRTELAGSLLANISQQESALNAGDFAGFATHAMRFHRSFVEMSGNSIMLSFYDRLGDRQALSIVRSAPRIAQDPQVVLREHRELARLASAGDWIGFSDVLQAHQDHGPQH